MLPGTLKAKLDMNSSIDTEGLPMTISKQPFRKYVMPGSFLNLKKKFTSLNNQEFSLLNTTRKYFSKKIPCLSNSSPEIQAHSILNYSKDFRNVNFEEILQEDERGESTTFRKLAIKSLGKLGVVNQSIPSNKESLRRILSICPCKVSIVLNTYPNPKWWLSMPIHIKNKIKHLKIPFFRKYHFQLLNDTHLFKDFKNIESCTIYIGDSYDDGEESIPLSVGFLTGLCQIKTLKSLELDLSLIPISRETLTRLLNQISIYEPFRWYLKVLLEKINKHGFVYDDCPVEIHEVKVILNKLDFLALGCFDSYGNFCDSVGDRANMEHLTNKRRRILNIRFSLEQVVGFYFQDLFDICTSLKGIYLGPIGATRTQKKQKNWKKTKGSDSNFSDDDFKDESEDEDEKQITNGYDSDFADRYRVDCQNLDPKRWMSNLEDVVLYLDDVPGYSKSASEYLLSLLWALQDQSHNLRFLELFSSLNAVNYNFKQIENIHMRTHSLEQFALLEELKLISRGSDSDIQNLQPVLQTLSNLKKIHLVLKVGCKNDDPWDSSFPFEDCRNLQELKITIKPAMVSQLWGNFIKNYQYLQNLNVIEIHNQSEPMTLKTFCSLVERLLCLNNLRRLILQTQVQSSNIFKEIPVRIEELVKSSLDATLEGLRAQTKDFILSNRKLEELSIGKLEGFNFEYIKYI